MHHRIGAMGGEDAVKRGAVADIGLFNRFEPDTEATFSRQAA
jgi:hypothetical protein